MGKDERKGGHKDMKKSKKQKRQKRKDKKEKRVKKNNLPAQENRWIEREERNKD